MRHPGIEPGSIAWKATMLTFTPPIELLIPDQIFYYKNASAGKRTRISCLEGNNANLYTTDAVDNNLFCRRKF